MYQDTIRDCFEIGQTVLVRKGNDWVSREIKNITVFRHNLRHSVLCPQCGMPCLGEPRFWFYDYGNVSLNEIMAIEDIDPDKIRTAASM